MLKKQNRLVLGTRLMHCASYTSPLFTLKVSKNGFLYNRYGFVVSKKIDKRAVKRNRTKRIISMCIEKNLGIIQSGFDMLFIVKQEIIQKDQQEICFSVLHVLKKEDYLK